MNDNELNGFDIASDIENFTSKHSSSADEKPNSNDTRNEISDTGNDNQNEKNGLQNTDVSVSQELGIEDFSSVLEEIKAKEPAEKNDNRITEGNTVETDDAEEGGFQAYLEEKKTSGEVFGTSKKGAAKLKRQLILSILICSFLGLFLIAYLGGGKKEEKIREEKIGSANDSYIPDFEAMSDRAYKKAAQTDTVPNIERTDAFTEDELIQSAVSKMPDLNEAGQAPVNPQGAPQSGGGGYSKPDTRNNYVQKQIQGIKGLTPTGRQVQQSYGQAGSGQVSPANPYGSFNIPSKEEFIQQMMGKQGLQGSFLQGFNNNAGKENFYTQNKGAVSQGEFLNSLTIWQGTIIPAVLITGINTDLPGNVIARVTENIYSSLDGRFLLIPQGTLLFANYNSSVSYAQNRIQVGWTHMIRPDGFFVELGNMAGVDRQGYSGYKGRVDNHPWAFIKGLFLISALAVVDTDINGLSKSLKNDPYLENILKRTESPYKKVTEKIIDRALDIQPTITIKSGVSINILANSNLTLPPVEIPAVTQKYKRY